MKIDYIDIKINDEGLFKDVVRIIDLDFFKEEVAKIRQAYSGGQLIPRNQFVQFLGTLEEENILSRLNSEITDLRRKLYLPLSFERVIEAAAFFGEVTEEDYKSASLVLYDVKHDENGDSYDFTHAILVNPFTRREDAIKVLDEYLEELGNKSEESLKNYRFIPDHTVKLKKKYSAKRRHRLWHHLFQKNTPLKDISTETIKVCPIHGETKSKDYAKKCICNPSDDVIRKGIKSYLQFLREIQKF